MPTPLTDADKVLRNDTGKDIVEKLDDIAQALGVGVNADQINYNNTESGLEAENVQNAIDELNDNKADKTDLDITTSITTPAPIMTFNDGGDNIPLKSLVTEIVPIQEGSGVPSPSNVRAISGFSSVKIEKSGKNLISQLYQFSSQLIEVNETERYKLAIKKDTYTISGTFAKQCSVNYKKSANDSVVYLGLLSSGNSSLTFTISEDMVNCDFYLYNSSNISVSDISNLQLELNDEATTYEAYKGSNTTIPLGQTVYGGSLECVNGEGQSNLGIIDLGDLTWEGPDATYHRFTANVSGLISSGTRLTKLYCSCYQTIDDGRPIGEVPNNSVYTAAVAPSERIFIHDTQYSSASDFTTAVTGQKLVFPITPTSLSVSGANIPTLSGTNNVYTDCGDIQSLEYYNNKTDELANLIRLMTRS